MLGRIEDVADSAMKAHGTPKTHYDDRIQLAKSWNQFPGLEDHAVSAGCLSILSPGNC
jgi:hypothetical protein